MGHDITLTGANVVNQNIVVPIDRSGETPVFNFEFEFASPLDITRFERIVVEWDGVHPQVSGMATLIYFTDDHRTGRYSIMRLLSR